MRCSSSLRVSHHARLIDRLGQLTWSPTGRAIVMSSWVQPSRWMSAEVPLIAPPRGTVSALVTPFTRVTGSSSLSGLICTSARMLGFTLPVSFWSLVPSTLPTSISPSTVNGAMSPG